MDGIQLTNQQTVGSDRSVHVQITTEWNDEMQKSWPEQIKRGLIDMATDMASKARARAPYVTGALKNSILVNFNTDEGVEVIAGGNTAKMDNPPPGIFKAYRYVNYADKREQGPNRNPNTEHYMEYGLQDILNTDWRSKYFSNLKGVTK